MHEPESVRRRHAPYRSSSEVEWTAAHSDGCPDNAGGWMRAPSTHDAAGTGAGEAAAAFFSSLGKAIGEGSNALVARLKKVSSQPSMGQARGNAFSEAADGMLSSIRHGLLPKGTLNSTNARSRPDAVHDPPPFYSRTSAPRIKGNGKSD